MRSDMSQINEYWLDDPQRAPYATFLSVLTSYLNPEVMDEEGLKDRTTTYADLAEMVTSKKEFREVIADSAALRKGALRAAAHYEDDSEEALLAPLWRVLYGDESVS
jgi:hypothetical protein